MSKYIAVLTLCIMMAVFASPVLAGAPQVEYIEMDPGTPEVWDDITCHAVLTDIEGGLENVRFRWHRNGASIRFFDMDVSGDSVPVSDTLESRYTEEDDVIRCTIGVWDVQKYFGSGDITVTVLGTSENNHPVIEIPDQEVEAGDDFELDLWDFASDIEDPDDELDFSITFQSNTDIMDCWISSDRFLRCSTAQQSGTSALTVKVEDTEGAWDTDTFETEVTTGGSGDDSPVIESIDIDPDNPEEDDDLTCEVDVEDDDGNLEEVEFRWYVEGDLERTRTEDVSGYTDTAEDTLDSSEFDDGDQVRCRVTVEDEDGGDDTDSKTVEIGDEANCRIDVRSLDVENDEDIEFIIKNTGDYDADVEYRIYIDDDRVERDDIDVDEGDSERISFRYRDFGEGGTYFIRVSADADCGKHDDSDSSTIVYRPHDDGGCTPGYVDSYRCSGSWQQRLYRYSNCNTVWRNLKHCTQGCSGGTCTGEPGPSPVPGCTFSIDSFKYSQTVVQGGTGFVEAGIRNTGSQAQDFEMEVYLDDEYLGTRMFILATGAGTTKSWSYHVPDPGTHRVAIIVNTDCGTSQTREGLINSGTAPPEPPGVCNFNGVCEAGENWYNCPYDCEEPEPEIRMPTSVDITPGSMDVVLYKSKVITIDIESFTNQDFSMTVEGVPQEWLTYENIIPVDGKELAYVFVNPKEMGMHNMRVRMVAEKEGLTFTENVRMFVASGDEGEYPSADMLTGFVTSLAGNVWAIILIIVITACTLVLVSYRYLRIVDKTTFDKR